MSRVDSKRGESRKVTKRDQPNNTSRMREHCVTMKGVHATRETFVTYETIAARGEDELPI